MLTKKSTKTEWRKWWVNVLKSGKRIQGEGRLKRRIEAPNGKDQFGYCCLGVVAEKLCSVFGESEQELYDGNFYLDGDDTGLTQSLTKRVGLATATGLFSMRGTAKCDLIEEMVEPYVHYLMETYREYMAEGKSFQVSLADLNDSRVPFKVIAKIIELRPIGLFGKWRGGDDN